MIWQNMTGIKYRLFLYTNNRENLGEIDYTDISFTSKFRTNDSTLDFTISYYYNGIIKVKTDNINKKYDLTKVNYLVLLKVFHDENCIHNEYFKIQNPSSEYNEGKTTKKISCKTESNLFFGKKLLQGYETVSLLYSSVSATPSLLGTMMDKIYNVYTIGYVNSDYLNQSRSWNYTDNNYIEIFDDLTKQFDMVVEIDNYNRVINLKKPSEIGEQTGIIISDRNLIKNLNNTNKLENYVSRLYVSGKNSISITKYNITGQRYVEDYSCFANNGEFSDSLLTAYNNYMTLLNSKKGQFTGYVNQLDTYEENLLTAQDELAVLNQSKVSLESQLDAIKDASYRPTSNYSTLYSQYSTLLSQISSKQSQIDSINNQITTVNNNIIALQQTLSWKNNYTTEQLEELIEYVYEEPLNLNTISDEKMLYEYALIYISQKSKIPLNLEIDMGDMLRSEDYKNWWDKLKSGNYVTINCPTIGYTNETLRLVQIQHNPVEASLSIVCSNTDIIDTLLYDIMAGIFAPATQSSSTFENNQDKYSEYSNDKDKIVYTGNTIDASTNPIVTNGSILSQRGLLGVSNTSGFSGAMQLLKDKIVFSPDGNFQDYYTMLSATSGLYLENSAGTSITNVHPTNGFNMYRFNGSSWVNNVYIGTDGNINITGNINASTITGGTITGTNIYTLYDITVGNNVNIGNLNSLEEKSINFYNYNSMSCWIKLIPSGGLDIVNWDSINIVSPIVNLGLTNSIEINESTGFIGIAAGVTAGVSVVLADNSYILSESPGNYISKYSETGNSLSYNSSTKTLSLKDVNGNTLSTVTLS